MKGRQESKLSGDAMLVGEGWSSIHEPRTMGSNWELEQERIVSPELEEAT